ncbi:hypothetical protein A9Q84_19320 [Halobacteriovorax marinus]|uniref:Glycosyl transferase family 1 domain-containing protein n=1 Tax=Halobacteriovorax marinus TaxID=97084 RepID=A0A1Y5F2G7_9BACT|nr:hypothetical protein A9Q84_19320 [Halobacteriovorax marinus]
MILIRRKQTSDWVSCQSITKNLESLYRKSFADEVTTLEISADANKYDHWLMAKEIATLEPTHVVFIDHTPHPVDLVTSIFMQEMKVKPSFIFHIFGDFSLQSQSWLQIEEVLKDSKSIFICASDKEVLLLKNLINAKEGVIQKLPFPIDGDFFKFDEKKVKNNKKFKFLYTGRLSDQKNIMELIQYFNQYNKTINPETELVIAGPYDDLGIPFLGKRMKKGSYGLHVENLISSLANDNIKVIGNCNHEELRQIYHECDAYVSLSTHNDEDYGMAPAEALTCGLPCLLSDWGGFSSFSFVDFSNVVLTPVEIRKNKILPEAMDVVKKLHLISSKKLEISERAELSNKALKRLSIDGLIRPLKEIYKTELKEGSFHSFHGNFKSLSTTHLINGATPYFRAPNGSYSTLYKEIYAPYFKRLISEN